MLPSSLPRKRFLTSNYSHALHAGLQDVNPHRYVYLILRSHVHRVEQGLRVRLLRILRRRRRRHRALRDRRILRAHAGRSFGDTPFDEPRLGGGIGDRILLRGVDQFQPRPEAVVQGHGVLTVVIGIGRWVTRTDGREAVPVHLVRIRLIRLPRTHRRAIPRIHGVVAAS